MEDVAENVYWGQYKLKTMIKPRSLSPFISYAK